MIVLSDSIEKILLHQLRSFWDDIDEERITKAIPETLREMEKGYFGSPNKRFWNGSDAIFSPYMSVQWMIFLYRLSHLLYLRG